MKFEHNTSKNADLPQFFDVIIIGGGAAGLSAALWCDELGLNALLLEEKPELGGQLLRVYNPIKNHLGVETENGQILCDIFIKQIAKRAFTINLDGIVSNIDLDVKTIFLANGKVFSAKFLIIATGVRRRKLNIEGEESFKNRGLIESGKRDSKSFAGKNVCIVGGGDAALENALILSETAAQVFLVHRKSDFRARNEFVEKVQSKPNVKIFGETIVTKILGSTKIEAVEVKNLKNEEIFTLAVEGILTRIGVEPNTELFRGKLKLDADGYIAVNGNCETSAENIFAAGDAANRFAPTVSSAVGMGATCVKYIFDKLNKEM